MKEKKHYFYAWTNRSGETCFGETSSVSKRMKAYVTGNGALPEPHFILSGNVTTIKSLEDDIKEHLKIENALLMIDGQYYEWLVTGFEDFEAWVLKLAEEVGYQVGIVKWNQ